MFFILLVSPSLLPSLCVLLQQNHFDKLDAILLSLHLIRNASYTNKFLNVQVRVGVHTHY